MQLTVRHLTGSRAGQQQTFDTTEVTLGRHPANMVLFDPEQDRVVSGKHAAIRYEQNAWVIHDLGSSNGTFLGGENIRQRILKPGDVIQLGKNGPQLQVEFPSDEASTVVVPLDDLHSAPREGRTVIMMMPGAEQGAAAGAAAPAGAAYAGAAAPKKRGLGRAVAIVAGALVVLLIGAVALAFAVRSSNIKKRKAVAAQKSTQPLPTQQSQAEVERINQQIAQQQQEIAATQATLEKTENQGASAQEIEDLKRQLAESQAMLEQMTREVQAKNDQISAAQSRPAQPDSRNVAPRPSPKSKSATAERVPAATATQPPPSQPAAAPATTAPPAATTAQLFTGKKLKKRVLITPLPPEIPPANLPSSTARDLANLLTTALVSTGDFVVGPKGQGSVSVMVTNYRADVKKSVDTKKASDSARRLGKIFGQNVPANPVDVKSVAYDAAMSVKVRLYDSTGRLIGEVQPSAASSDRKTKSAVAGVSFHDVALSDTAIGDVARKVIGDSIDTIRRGLADLEWSTTVSGQSRDKVTLSGGRNMNLEPGDVFDVYDGRKLLARVRINSVTETTSEAEFVGKSAKVSGKVARYVGSETATASQASDRAAVVRTVTDAYDGPGDSFNTIRRLKVGQRLQLHYVVGSWARTSDGGATFWVPIAKVQIIG